MRRPTKSDSLRKMRALNLPINAVIDVGVLTGTWELMSIYGDVKHLLVEPVSEWNEEIRPKYDKAGVEYHIENVAAAEHDTEFSLRVWSVREDKRITHSHLSDSPVSEGSRKVKGRRLDTLVPECSLQPPYLLKIDVDGAELRVLEGAIGILSDCAVIVLEAGVRSFMERANWLVPRGFELFDIVDICYYDDRLRQFDIVFLNSRLVQELDLDMYKQRFDIAKWVPFT